MGNEQYAKYKNQFKLDCILKAVSSGLALCAIIFFVFLPNFLINDPLFGITLYSFSLFDEIKVAFSSFSDGALSFSAIFSIYQIFALIFVILGLVMCVVTLIKNIINIFNPETYALEQYNDIKKDNKKHRGFNMFSATNCFITAIMMEILYIVMTKSFSGMSGSFEETGSLSNLYLVNGVSGLISLFIIFTIGFIGITVYDKLLTKKIKYEILKEDYGVSENDKQN